MKAKIWMGRPLGEPAMAALETAFEVFSVADLDALPGATAAITRATDAVDVAFLDRAGPALKAVARLGVGVDNIDIPAATQRGVPAVNTPDAPTESTAEHTVALLLALSKRVVWGDQSLRGRPRMRLQLLGTEARGRLLGVVGLGRIGRRVAQICKLGLGMRVITYDPYVDRMANHAIDGEIADDLESLLSQADFVTLHCQLTPETKHLIGERELRIMKPYAYLINVSRGAVLDEGALLRILKAGHLAGAALDVFDPDPPAPDNPLFELDNVVVTPHLGSYTDRGICGMETGVVDQILRVLRGERPAHLLNPEVWRDPAAG